VILKIDQRLPSYMQTCGVFDERLNLLYDALESGMVPLSKVGCGGHLTIRIIRERWVTEK
jgi:hypothetical protein